MKHSITFDNDLGCFIITTSGSATVLDILAMVDELFKDDRWRSGANVIIDHRLTELDALTSEDAHGIGNFVIRLKQEIGGRRVAHVVARTVDYGMIRMWENLIGDHVLFEFRVFYSIEDAREWISSSGTTGPPFLKN